jgi:hypothetical protein
LLQGQVLFKPGIVLPGDVPIQFAEDGGFKMQDRLLQSRDAPFGCDCFVCNGCFVYRRRPTGRKLMCRGDVAGARLHDRARAGSGGKQLPLFERFNGRTTGSACHAIFSVIREGCITTVTTGKDGIF